MIDLQNESDTRGIRLSCAGVRALHHPISLEIDGIKQTTLATFSCSVMLEQDKRGTHMSRFLEVISEPFEGKPSCFSLENLSIWHKQMLHIQQASSGELKIQCPFFLKKTAPASGKRSPGTSYGVWFFSSGGSAAGVDAPAAEPP